MNFSEAIQFLRDVCPSGWVKVNGTSHLSFVEANSAIEIIISEVERLKVKLAAVKNEIYGAKGIIDDLNKEFNAEKIRANVLFAEEYNRRLQIDKLQAKQTAATAVGINHIDGCEIGVNYRNEVTIYTDSRTKAETVFRWLQSEIEKS